MIRSVPLPARRLLTVGEDHPAWRDLDAVPISLEGALVRLLPPPGAPEGRAAELEARLLRAGAARVKVVPRASAPEAARRIDVDPSPRATPREAVMSAASEARSSDPAALRALLEGILDEEGL